MLAYRETCESLLALLELHHWAKFLYAFEQELATKGASASVVGGLTREPTQSLLDNLDRSIARRCPVVFVVVDKVGGGAPKTAAVAIRERIAGTGLVRSSFRW
jgi:hypothetical protein